MDDSSRQGKGFGRILFNHWKRISSTSGLKLGFQVYNVTEYLRFHPGGRDELMKGVGRDGTFLFGMFHTTATSLRS